MRHWLLAFALWLVATVHAAPVELAAADDMRSLRGHWSVLLDRDRNLGIADVRRLPAAAFDDLTADFSAGYADAAAWLRFELARTADAPVEWWLAVGPNYLDRIELYTPEGGDTARVVDLQAPWSQRSVGVETAVFPLNVAPAGHGEAAVYYMRVTNRTALTAFAALWRPTAFVRASNIESLLHGAYIFTALVIVVINLFYWYSLRLAVFPAFIGCVAGMALYFLQLESYQLMLFQPERPPPVKLLMTLTQCVMVWFAYWFFAALVRPERHWPRLAHAWRRINQGAVAVGAVLLLAGQYKPTVPALWVVVMFGLAFNTAVSVHLAWRGDRSAMYFLAAIAGLIAMMSVRLAYGFGLLDSYGIVYDHGLLLASVVFWVLTQIIMLDMLNRARHEHEAARDRALVLARRGEAMLEAKVEKRTRDLERTREQLAQALDQEQQANIDQRRFLRMVAHEFRTPLATVRATTALLEIEAGNDPAVRQRNIDRLHAATSRMTRLVEGALAQDRFESAAWRANVSRISVPELLGEVVAVIRDGDGSAHPVTVDCPELSLQADRELLRIVLHNLLDNAVRYSPPGSPVSVTAVDAGDGSVAIRVCDRGIGIPREEQRHIFGKYYRVPATAASSSPGLGLGLYLVDSVVRLHGGRVEVDGEPGQGTCFSLFFPLHQPDTGGAR